jgi:hypothetical protein
MTARQIERNGLRPVRVRREGHDPCMDILVGKPCLAFALRMLGAALGSSRMVLWLPTKTYSPTNDVPEKESV